MCVVCCSESESSSEGVRLVRNPYWYTLLPENVSDPVVETFGDIWDLQVRPFCVEKSRVFVMVLFSFSYVLAMVAMLW